jgi:regulator of sigma E protease
MLTLSGLTGGISGALFVAAAFLFVLSIVVFVHEMGHFLVARWCGVKVSAFSMGFGPEICAFTDRHGTRWRIAWIPLGGYVKFMDDENGASVPNREAMERMTPQERSESFHSKPLWQRAAVVAAGPIANFLLAILIFTAVFSIWGVRVTEPKVGEVIAGSPALQAGFQKGDLIRSIDGNEITSFNQVLRIVSASPEVKLVVGVERGGRLVSIPVVPELKEIPDTLGGVMRRGIIGIRPELGPGATEMRPTGVVEAMGLGVKESWFVVTATFQYLYKLTQGKESADQLGGPVRIAEVSGQVAKVGFEPLLQLVAVISVSVGLINLFPIPLLDGGHLMFYAIEAVRRRPLSERAQEIGFRIGLAVVLSLMVFSFWNDRFIVLKWLTGGAVG